MKITKGIRAFNEKKRGKPGQARRGIFHLQWWGYRHTEGTVQVKRFFGDRASIEDAYQSDFVVEVVEPFAAATRDEALTIVSSRTNHGVTS